MYAGVPPDYILGPPGEKEIKYIFQNSINRFSLFFETRRKNTTRSFLVKKTRNEKWEKESESIRIR